MPLGKVVMIHKWKPESKSCKYRQGCSEGLHKIKPFFPHIQYVSSLNSKANHNKTDHFSTCALDLETQQNTHNGNLVETSPCTQARPVTYSNSILWMVSPESSMLQGSCISHNTYKPMPYKISYVLINWSTWKWNIHDLRSCGKILTDRLIKRKEW